MEPTNRTTDPTGQIEIPQAPRKLARDPGVVVVPHTLCAEHGLNSPLTSVPLHVDAKTSIQECGLAARLGSDPNPAR